MVCHNEDCAVNLSEAHEEIRDLRARLATVEAELVEQGQWEESWKVEVSRRERAEAERDRYRKALEEIALQLSHYTYGSARIACQTARRALNPEQEEEK